MNSKLEESNKKKKRNALAEKLLLAIVSDGHYYGVDSHYPRVAIEKAYRIADEFIEYSNK